LRDVNGAPDAMRDIGGTGNEEMNTAWHINIPPKNGFL
jgi:hypothetical protein